MTTMSNTVSIDVAKRTLSKLLACVAAGEEFTITRNSVPVARLVPIRHVATKRRFGALRGKARVDAAFFEPLSEAEMKGWE
jgi:prevent-host-death family protein